MNVTDKRLVQIQTSLTAAQLRRLQELMDDLQSPKTRAAVIRDAVQRYLDAHPRETRSWEQAQKDAEDPR